MLLDQLAEGFSEKFVDGGPLHRVLYIHRVLLLALEPFVIYCNYLAMYSSTSKLIKYLIRLQMWQQPRWLERGQQLQGTFQPNQLVTTNYYLRRLGFGEWTINPEIN